jgi:opacity protein-like surface antigen
MKTIVATVLLAMAIASPALAQSAQYQSQHGARSGQYGTYQGYPTSEWQRPDSW